MSRQIDFSVIIVNYNSSRELTVAVDDFLAAHCEGKLSWEIIIVDNGSGTAERQALQTKFTQIKYKNVVYTYFLDSNIGFGGANNYGAARARGRNLLLLNPDTRCPEAILPALALVLEAPDVGLAAPRLCLPDGQAQAHAYGRFPTLRQIVRQKWQRHENAEQLLEADRPQEVGWVSGAAMAISREHWETLGGFDARFFMYFEDVDLCRRARAAGWHNWVVPTVKVIHLGGARTTMSRGRRARYFAGQNVYWRQWCPGSYPLLRALRWPYEWYCQRHDQP